MRAWLATAAALVGLIALAVALWLGGSAREEAPPERRVEHAGEEARPAADLAPIENREQGKRQAAPLPEVEPASEAQPSRADAGAAGRMSAPGDDLAKLVVRVVDEEDGAPLQGVSLFHFPWPPQPLPEDFEQTASTTDEFGLATLRVPPGGRQVYALSQEDRKVIVELAPGERREETLRLRSRADLDVHLLVVDGETGATIAGAEAKAESYPEERAVRALTTAVADGEGRLVLKLPSWIFYQARVTARGYASMSVSLRGMFAGSDHARTVALLRAARLEGIVTGANGVPRTEVAVTANASEEGDGFETGVGEHLSDLFWSAETDPDGRYVLADLPPGADLTLAVRSTEQLLLEERTPLRLAPGEVRRHDFRVDVDGIIRGTLLDPAGAPVAHQRLWLARGPEARELHFLEDPVARTSTDAAGRFSFEGVPRGTWLIAPEPLEKRPPGYPMPMGQAVELPEGVPAVDVELRLPAGLSVSGRCVDRAGDPVAGVEVSAVAVGPWASASAVSAADGTFAIGPLPAGELALFVRHDTLALDARELPRARAGDTGVILRMAVTARVRGTVVDAASGARVSAEVSASVGEQGMVGGTWPDGSFLFQDLPPGRCLLVARTPPSLVSMPCAVELRPGEEASVELRVAPGAQVRVLLPADQGQVVAHVLVGGDLVTWLDPGPGTTGLVPPGPFTVELRNLFGGVLATKQGSAAVGVTVEIDLR